MDEQQGQPSGDSTGGDEAAAPVRKSARITHHEIKAMKAVTTKAPPAHISALNKVKATFTDMVTSFITPFSGVRKSNQCELNGHIFPKSMWEGEFPKCTHCGKEIRSTDEAGTQGPTPP
jgi:hypothetical protein